MRPIRSLIAAAALAAVAAVSNLSAAESIGGFEAGKHYRVIASPPPRTAPAGKVEVAEVFMYGCPHCYALEPALNEWLAKKPDYVSVTRIPAPWNVVAVVHARAYFAAETFGKTEQAHAAFFAEIHERGNLLDTKEKVVDFYARFGIDRTAFSAAYDATDAKVRAAYDLIAAYGVDGTPGIVVAGKYLTNAGMAETYPTWFAIIEALAAHEHGEK